MITWYFPARIPAWRPAKRSIRENGGSLSFFIIIGGFKDFICRPGYETTVELSVRFRMPEGKLIITTWNIKFSLLERNSDDTGFNAGLFQLVHGGSLHFSVGIVQNKSIVFEERIDFFNGVIFFQFIHAHREMVRPEPIHIKPGRILGFDPELFVGLVGWGSRNIPGIDQLVRFYYAHRNIPYPLFHNTLHVFTELIHQELTDKYPRCFPVGLVFKMFGIQLLLFKMIIALIFVAVLYKNFCQC